MDSQAAVKALLQECPEIAKLEPLLIRSRLFRLKVKASLSCPKPSSVYNLGSLTSHPKL